MTEDSPLHPAAERLLDAALVQHFTRPAVPRSAAVPTWLAAALVLLGLTVVTALWFVARDGSAATAQEPTTEPLPPEATANSMAEVEALPPTTVNLRLRLVEVRDLAMLTRFPRLRVLRLWAAPLQVFGVDTRQYHASWRKPPANLLQPLAQLPHLEQIEFASQFVVTPERLAPLAGHPALRSLCFGRDFVCDEAVVAALARLPQLRELRLSWSTVGAAALRAVARLPLEALEMRFSSGLDAEGWQALLTMHSLRRLVFEGWAWHMRGGGVEATPWRPLADDVRGLQQLPHLRYLELRGCAIDDAQCAALPDTLTTLRLVGTTLTPEGVGSLRRCLALRELELAARPVDYSLGSVLLEDSAAHAAAFAAALQPLRLQSLHYRGASTPAVVAAVGAQSALRRVVWAAPVDAALLTALAALPALGELELRANAIPDLAALAAATSLARLTLAQSSIGNGMPAAVLAPLARAAALREIVVHVSVVRGEPFTTEQELQRAVGERIEVRLHSNEFTVTK